MKIAGMGITAALGLASALPAVAAELGQDARAAIPQDVQQLIVVDYRAMQNSSSAMDLKAHILPPSSRHWSRLFSLQG